MADPLRRCGPRASARADPMLGTAFPAARILLVEQPGSWGPAGLAASRFDPAAARELTAAAGRQGIRVLAIRRPGRRPEVARRSWILADTRSGRQCLVDGSFGADRELFGMVADLFEQDCPVSVDPNTGPPVFAVCAHGTHDACCAVEGRPVAAALHRLRPDQVWECSHVGGDRFAANVLVLPGGQLYGRVTATDAARLVSAAEQGTVLPDLLRGLVGQPPAAQAALAFAHRRLDPSGRTSLSVRSVEGDTEAGYRVLLDTGRGAVRVSVQVSVSEPELLTCRATRALRAASYHPVAIEPA